MTSRLQYCAKLVSHGSDVPKPTAHDKRTVNAQPSRRWYTEIFTTIIFML